MSYLTSKLSASSHNYKELPSYRIAQRKPEYFTLLHWCLYNFFHWNRKKAMNFLKATQQITDIIKNQNLEPFFVAFIYATAIIRLISICWEVKAMLSWNKDLLKLFTRASEYSKDYRLSLAFYSSQRGSASKAWAKYSFLQTKLSPLEEPLHWEQQHHRLQQATN